MVGPELSVVCVDWTAAGCGRSQRKAGLTAELRRVQPHLLHRNRLPRERREQSASGRPVAVRERRGGGLKGDKRLSEGTSLRGGGGLLPPLRSSNSLRADGAGHCPAPALLRSQCAILRVPPPAGLHAFGVEAIVKLLWTRDKAGDRLWATSLPSLEVSLASNSLGRRQCRVPAACEL